MILSKGDTRVSCEPTSDSPGIFCGQEFEKTQNNLWLNALNVSAKTLKIYILLGCYSLYPFPMAFGRT